MEPDTRQRPWIERIVASRQVRSVYSSLVAHVIVLLLLAMLVRQQPPAPQPLRLELSFAVADVPAADGPVTIEAAAATAGGADEAGDHDEAAEAAPTAGPPRQLPSETQQAAESSTAIPPERLAAAEPATEPGDPAQPRPARAEPQPAAVAAAAPATATVADDAEHAAAGSGSSDPAAVSVTHPPAGSLSGPAAFAGRRGEGRRRGLAKNGGSAASEAAVAGGLAWLARHQAPDGSWRFDLSGCRCDGACRHPGTVTSTTAATGIALLPFLGAGHTHEEGTHRETVTRGIYYLMSRLQATPRGGDLSEGTMYGHGVATLALAEALGMTGDRMLVPYVRDAVRFIETSQDLHGGGWRYLPGQAGDTTVTAWQLAALKSAAFAGVAVPSPTVDGVCRFLDRVQVRDGEGYGYLSPQDRPCTSAIGLLCRIYTTWPDKAALDRGLARLAKRGPDREAVYQNFYLSQALLLHQHVLWERWNKQHRDQLVARQDRIGHEAGSWSFADADTAPGGRLGHTALAILTLEVYYRLLPIYTTDAAEMRW